MIDSSLHPLPQTPAAADWETCTFQSCSVLPVRLACNLSCPFCFSKSSVSALRHETTDWRSLDVAGYYHWARERGANRLVITGGGEPLLKPADVLYLVQLGSSFFDEITCFTNGTYLTPELSRQLRQAGLSYLCYSRHHQVDDRCRELMGRSAPTLSGFFAAAEELPVRATCVMTRGYVETVPQVWDYIETLSRFGVTEFTFKHTYVAYEQSVFGDSGENLWAKAHQVEYDPFAGQGTVLRSLPWGPAIRRIGRFQVCYYFEPTPGWELEQRACRSSNLLSDGTVYASLEDQRSRLYRLSNC